MDCRFAILQGYTGLPVTGEDATSFLQGQLCGDVAALTIGESMLTAAPNPRGRVIAIVRLLRSPQGYDLVLPTYLAEPLAQRLRMYVLRAKVSIGDPSGAGRVLGLWGEGATQAADELSAGRKQAIGLLNVAGTGDTLLAHPDHDASDFVERIDAHFTRATAEEWHLAETRAGIPEIGPDTSEAFIPQMLNLDLLGGVSFTKGCYVGQEVIARAFHLGRVKRRSRLFHVGTDTAPTAGQSVYSAGRPVGTVARVATDGDGYAILAVTPSEDLLTLAADSGPGLHELSLPYRLPEEGD